MLFKFLSIVLLIIFVFPFLFRLLMRFFLGKNISNQNNASRQRGGNTSTHTKQTPQKKKVFPENEGEYVEYEEVKD